jgi:Ca2+-binding EF-hand superfamily protein
LDIKEVQYGLADFGISLDDEQAKVVLQNFDRDRSGTVDFDEFLRVIRGDLNAFRLSLIRKAYEKLDVNRDGSVKLDDIAKIYDVSKSPDVVNLKKDPLEVYKQFMNLWDTQVADGIVTFDEFCDYFKDVSASIDNDDYFALMMKNAWKIDA